MNKVTLALVATVAMGTVQAGYTVKIQIDAPTKFSNWVYYDTVSEDWENIGSIHSCSNWSPSPSEITIGQIFTQKATDCKQNQVRTAQNRLVDKISGDIRNDGDQYTETQSITLTQTRESIGALETWTATTPTYTDWKNNGSVTDCTNWSPATSTIKVGQLFTQTATDCKQEQIRSRQEREQETTTNEIRNISTAIIEKQIINVSSTRSATGTKETWAATIPIYTDWTNSGSVTDCTNWSPATSAITVGQSFTQTATDCKQKQIRSRQDREKESTTNEIRNIGTAVTEDQTITVSSTRSATGTKETWVAITPAYTVWANSGAIANCTNWSPATSTTTVGQSFTQTATDCKQTQTRSRQDREQETSTNKIRNVGVAVTENQIINVSSTRSATGTKETWVATTPTYTAWTNTNALYGCSNWSPAGSTKTITTTFTQTATDCKTDQSRTRQDREQESTTKAYRNKGTAVKETQMLTAQKATRSYTVTLGSWSNSGSATGCTNWAPETSTVNSGLSFNQTATNCSQKQTRFRVEKYVDHKSGSTVQVSSNTESQTLTNQKSTRTATGTKEIKECRYNVATQNHAEKYGSVESYLYYWDGGYIGGGASTTFSTGGYKYSVSTFKETVSTTYVTIHRYEICRTPI